MEFLFERIFALLFSITNSYGLAILLISVLISLILMPFYHITNILENREKAIRLKLQPYILKINKIKDAHIKHKSISKLYRSYGYSPIKSLRSLSSLIIQIPFFIVAYRVLSRILATNLYNADLSFLFIKNLGSQDALLGGVNLLPVLMTYINIISVMLMTPFKKERKQSYVIAVFFLVLLYMSPAGLVLYWTSNNFINLLRYLFIYLKEKNFRSVKYKLINYFSSIFRNEGSRVFIFLVSMYFIINLMPRSHYIVFHTFVVIPLVAAFFFRIYDYIKINDKYTANPNIRNITKEKKQFLIKLPLVILCLLFYFFVKGWEKVYWLCGDLILLAIYNYKSIKFNKIRNVFKSIALPMSAMLFPALLYANSNPFFFKCIDMLIFFAILSIFSCLLPFFIYVFNNRLSVNNTIIFSTTFISAFMFLPLIREVISYTGKYPIDFILLFAILLFIFNLLKKRKKEVTGFFLCASCIIFLVSGNLFVVLTKISNKISNIKDKIAYSDEIDDDVYIPKELADMKMKDTPAIYLFMHDAFPHKELIQELNLDVSKLNTLLKKYDFTEYNVYSLGDNTAASMAGVFNISEKHIKEDYWELKKESYNTIKYWQKSNSGYNFVSMLLKKMGYSNFISMGSEKWLFGDTITTTSIRKAHDIKKGWGLLLLYSLLFGKMNSMEMLEYVSDSSSLELAQFANNQNNNDKIFAWGFGYPEHSSNSNRFSEYELKKWVPRYYRSINDMEREFDLTVTKNPDAIVILMSDHGPWLLEDATKYYPSLPSNKISPIHFRDTFGAFMAIRWPDKERAAKYDKEFNVIQDLFPIVLSYLYDSPKPLKYKIKNTSVRIKDHKFDKGIFYPHFYKDEE